MSPPLPNEVLQHIFSFLRPSLRRKGHGHAFDAVAPDHLAEEASRQVTLSRVSRSSKQLRRLALPFLYHTIPMTSAKLLPEMSKNAELAGYVRAIDLSHTGIDRSTLRDAFKTARPWLSLPSAFERLLEQAIDRVGDDLTDTGAEAALHLSLLKNLEALEYRGYIGSNDLVTAFFDGAASSDEAQETQVPHLRELRLRHWSGENTTRITHVQRLLQSSVEKLYACAINWEVDPNSGEGRPLAVGPQLSLKHVDLVDATINGPGLDDMLQRCPDLITLSIVWGDPSRMPTFPLDFNAIGAALRQHARGLEKLTLDCSEELSYTQGHSEGRLGPLSELPKLKVLVVAQDVLVGEDEEEGEEEPLSLDQVLPSSLEILRLLTCQDDEENLDEQLVDLIKGGRLSKLRRVQMKRNEDFAGDAAELGWKLWHRWDKMILIRL
ncbi:hypothetical protein JX265_004762 [Neoarthrinium moseri]|uniref:F-box domain-containing protein n=1 Tax=Neoarthrinium moseri TaxID=1658444 RepID=A0A9Q0ASH1_9PEZI|nr:hypothetical protein JX265_004762 [Neoarthrinium moseri]